MVTVILGIVVVILIVTLWWVLTTANENRRAWKVERESLRSKLEDAREALDTQRREARRAAQESPAYPNPRLSRPVAAPTPSTRSYPPAEPSRLVTFRPQQSVTRVETRVHESHDGSLLPGMVLGAMLHDSMMDTHQSIEAPTPSYEPAPSYDPTPSCCDPSPSSSSDYGSSCSDSSSSYSSSDCGSSDSGGSCSCD